MSQKKPFIIGITGGSGSGKTSFIKEMRKRFENDELCIISQDDYYFPRDQQITDQNGYKNFDLPGSIDADSFARELKMLSKGESVSRLEYTFNNEKAEPEMLTFKSAPVILVEGLFVFHFEAIRDQMDLRIYIHADDVRKLKRRILRDRLERNYPLEDVLYRYEAHVLPAYRKYIEPYKESSDIIIINNDHFQYGLETMEAFIHKKIAE
jgi:uridine kinase